VLVKQAATGEHDDAIQIAGILTIELLGESGGTDPAADPPAHVPSIEAVRKRFLLQELTGGTQVECVVTELPEELHHRQVATIGGCDGLPIEIDLEPVGLPDHREAARQALAKSQRTTTEPLALDIAQNDSCSLGYRDLIGGQGLGAVEGLPLLNRFVDSVHGHAKAMS